MPLLWPGTGKKDKIEVNLVFLTFQLLISVIVGTGHQLLLELFQKELHYWNIPRGFDAATKRREWIRQSAFLKLDKQKISSTNQLCSKFLHYYITAAPSASLFLARYIVTLFPQVDHTFQTHWISCHWWCGYAHCGPISRGEKQTQNQTRSGYDETLLWSLWIVPIGFSVWILSVNALS